MSLASPVMGGQIEASVVIVVGTDDPPPHAAVDAVLGAPVAIEVIVVANGTGAPDVSRSPQARVVTLAHAVPFGAAANHGASAAVGRFLCFVSPLATGTGEWLAPLLATMGDASVGCAVPQVVSPDGRLLEAGYVLDRDGAVTALPAQGADALEHLFPRRTDGGSRGCIGARRSSFQAAGGFDPTYDDPVAAGIGLSLTLRALGLETVYEPASRVVVRGCVAEEGDRPVAVRDAACGDRILVVSSALPSERGTHAERRVDQLVGDLASLMPDGQITVLALEGHGARRSAPRILRQGIEVATGPEDWDRWFRRRSLLFTHVVITDIASIRRLDGLLCQTQPQAFRVLAVPSLEFQDMVSASAAGDGPEDRQGRQLLVRTVEEQVARALGTFDAAWCATPQDQAWVASAAPGIPSVVIPTVVAPGTDVAFDRRSGYVVLGAPGADITAGHEDAVLHAVHDVLPRLLARDPDAFLRVVVDDPSPALQLLAGSHIELVPAGDDPGRWFRRSRVCLAWYPRGAGSREAIAMALDARTPFVTSAAAVRDRGLGRRLPPLVTTDDVLSMSLRAEHLHDRQDLWDDVHGELVRLADGPRCASAVRLKLLRACADAGIAPRPGARLAAPPAPVRPIQELQLRPHNVAVVGSAWKAAPPAADGPVPEIPAPVPDAHWGEVPVNDQYGRWCARYGPTPRRLARLAERLEGLVRRPRISIVMPVFDTEPSWLHDAISSVRSQVYDNWELCIGDDGSSDQRTLDVLDAHLAEEPRIRLVRLPGRQGIVGATNAALAVATGDFVGFLDHDDELKPHALGEIALALDDRADLDLIYTDEDKREPDGRLVDPFFKSDWSPDHLMSRNYVCHLLVVRRRLLDELGGLRPGTDGSQDYDLVLRATELTDRIAHVHEPLYTWRKVPGSTATDGDAKPWALDAAKRVLYDALERRGTPGDVVDGMLPTSYRVRYHLRGRPKVSILIPTRDRVDLLRTCIDSVRERDRKSVV